MLAAKLREADAKAESAEAAQKEGEKRARELRAELESVRQAAAETDAMQEEAVSALKAELAELRSAAPATPEKGRSGNLEGVCEFLAERTVRASVSESLTCNTSHSGVLTTSPRTRDPGAWWRDFGHI